MLRHAAECIAVQLIKLMTWSARAKVKGGSPDGISFGSTGSDIRKVLVCLHQSLVNYLSKHGHGHNISLQS